VKQIILMADIIKSRTKDSNLLMKDFKAIIDSANLLFKKKLKSPLTITLGDEFQGVIEDVKTAIEILLYLEEEFIHKKLDFKLRYVLLEGIIDTLINNKRAFEMLGPGLTESREKLFSLKETNNRFFISLENKISTDILNNSFVIFQSLVADWKVDKDYEIVSGFLQYHDYKKVSEMTHRNRSLIWKREKTLKIESYNAIKNIIFSCTKL
jgi:hypothetical protein